MPADSLVPPDRIKFGYGADGICQNRIIIKEEDDASKVKIYDKQIENKYYCVGCKKINVQNPAHIINGEVHEPGFHLCVAFSAAVCAAEQALFEKKFAKCDAVPADTIKCSTTSFAEATSSTQRSLTNKISNASQIPVNTAGQDIGKDVAAERDTFVQSSSKHVLHKIADTNASSKVLQPNSGSVCHMDLSSESSTSCPTNTNTTNQGEPERKIKYGDYKYGNGNDNTENRKIIVFEDNRDFVRVYNYSAGQWFCHGCFLGNGQKLYGKLHNDLFYPPSLHVCEPITRDEYEKDQQNIKAKHSPHFAAPALPNKCSEKIQSNANSNNSAEEISQNDRSNDVASHQPSSSNIVTARPNRIVDYMNSEYSFDPNSGEAKRRYTVYEEDRSFVRQYNVTKEKLWYCINCTTACIKKVDDDIEEIGTHACEPLSASEYKKADKLLFQKFCSIMKSAKTTVTSSSTNTCPNASVASNSTNTCSTPLEECNSTLTEHVENLETNLPSSNNIQPLRKLDFHEWQFKEKDRTRIIVFENDSTSLAREYNYNEERREIVCVRCLEIDPSKNSKGKRDDHDYHFLVPSAECHVCAPRPLNEISREKNNKKRARIQGDEDEPTTLKKLRNTVIPRSEKSGHENDENSVNGISNIVKPSSHINLANSNDSVSSVGCNVPKPNQTRFSLTFLQPSGNYLEQCCKKLKLNYSFNAIKFWSNITIRQITQESIPREVFSPTEENSSAFRCLSRLFTGCEDNFLIIKDALLPHLCSNATSLGEKYGHDLSRPDTPVFRQLVLGEVASKIHFETLSILLECKIGIIDNGQWVIYGCEDNGSTKNQHMILLQKTGCKYSIVLSLR